MLMKTVLQGLKIDCDIAQMAAVHGMPACWHVSHKASGTSHHWAHEVQSFTPCFPRLQCKAQTHTRACLSLQLFTFNTQHKTTTLAWCCDTTLSLTCYLSKDMDTGCAAGNSPSRAPQVTLLLHAVTACLHDAALSGGEKHHSSLLAASDANGGQGTNMRHNTTPATFLFQLPFYI